MSKGVISFLPLIQNKDKFPLKSYQRELACFYALASRGHAWFLGFLMSVSIHAFERSSLVVRSVK